VCSPEDVAAIVTFLVSDRGAYLADQRLTVERHILNARAWPRYAPVTQPDWLTEGADMVSDQTEQGVTARLIDTLENAEHVSLEAVRKFVDTVTDAFPDLGEDGPRRKIIDSAFKMTEQLVGASNRLAQNILEVTEKALSDEDRKPTSSSK
jgi:hypothetical protein